MTKIRVAIADNHPVVVAGLACELGRRSSLEILGSARDAAGIVDVLHRSPCDVLVTDPTLAGGEYGDGLSLLASLRRMFPEVRIVALTAMEDATLARQFAELGIASTLSKSRDIDDLVDAIHATHQGLRQTHGRHRAVRHDARSESRMTLLSQREAQVLRMYVSGLSINVIAARLHRTKQTISAQKRSAMRKLGMTSDAQLYRFALEAGLCDVSPATTSAADPA